MNQFRTIISRLLLLSTTIIVGCFNPNERKKVKDLQQQLDSVTLVLNEYKKQLTQLQNTPEQRIIRATRYFDDGNLEKSLDEFNALVDSFPGTTEAQKAKVQITKINALIEKQAREAERIKLLGFKALLSKKSVSSSGTKLILQKIWIGKTWTFDSYNDTYHYRSAERGNKFVLAQVSISSEDKDPWLPPIYAYSLKGDQLQYVGTLSYEFRRWKDYGSYLGNYSDYGNDFAHTKTIGFNLGLELNEDKLKDELFIVIDKRGCFKREYNNFSNPSVSYKNNCKPKPKLTLNDFNENYFIVHVFE